ncbi:hypothetical protein [Pectobacterium brasiliense]|uniref:hypothetical protein n=1 Tax=Pectobacterium brasiliense TaxID=180957 RepID=UPI0015DE7BA2|nr:hypothetical protein [Pectobacterium brasiliense]MBA0212131.1 hypothetical protein [Pectobacterium brasiliense]
MKKKAHEEPMFGQDKNGVSRKNPNNITINQHIIPKKHLTYWSSDGRNVVVKNISTENELTIPFDNPLFCVKRLWDQGVELDFKKIEDEYQSQLESVLNGGIKAKFNMNSFVDYYKSIVIRCELSKKERPHYVVGADLIGEHTKEQLEKSEWELVDNETGIFTIPVAESAESQSASRFVVRISIDMIFSQLDELFANTNWNIIFLEENHESLFISDAIFHFHENGFHLLPLTPRILLISAETKIKMGNALKSSVINKLMMKFSSIYCIKC